MTEKQIKAIITKHVTIHERHDLPYAEPVCVVSVGIFATETRGNILPKIAQANLRKEILAIVQKCR